MKKLVLSLLIVLCAVITSFAQEQYIAEIKLFAGNYAPRGWAFCNGQILSVSQNQALFALIGCTYGGDCRTTFALPDLRGRVPVHSGNQQGIGLSVVNLGEQGGTEKNTVVADVVTATTSGVKLDAQQTGRDGVPTLVTSVVVKNQSLNQDLNNRQPYLGLNYIIALEGYWPSRD